MDGNFRLQKGLTLLSKIWTSRLVQKDSYNAVNLMLKMVFNICSNFSENTFFRIVKKICLSGNFEFFSVFLVLWTTLFTSALKPG